MHTRREMLARSASVAAALAGLGLLPQAAQAAWSQAAFDAKNMGDLMKALGTANPAESKDVTITGPDIAENGAVVPVGAATTLPGVKQLLLLVEKNPNVLAAAFDVSDGVDPSFNTRVKMGQTSNINALVKADGKVIAQDDEVRGGQVLEFSLPETKPAELRPHSKLADRASRAAPPSTSPSPAPSSRLSWTATSTPAAPSRRAATSASWRVSVRRRSRSARAARRRLRASVSASS